MSESETEALLIEAAHLRELAVTDPLTGIANRRSFDERLAGEWQRCARSASMLGLIMVDVDHFKAYNDAYGHVAGDECLQRIASALSSAPRRPGDHVARYGGEEFAVILPDTDERGAAALAESMRAAIAALALPHCASPLGFVSASFGIAALVPEPAEPPNLLVRAADAALYEAKEAGRNSVAGRETPHNLPAGGHRLIGRAHEVARVHDLLLGDVPVVTLVGSGGVGKTRLALEVANGLRAHFSDGVWLVDLGAMSTQLTAEGIADVAASAIGLRARPGAAALETLCDALSGRRVLLVLDTAEHVRSAVREFAAAVRTAVPRLRLLITSRVALRLDGEHAEHIGPLEPSAGIDLFVARAIEAVPALRAGSDLAAAAADVVARVDGLPLAIELAAARLTVLAPRELAEHVADRVRVLRRRGSGRHDTLTALLDWSFALLEPAEQRTFVQLAIFAGGWTLESARAVCADEDAESSDVLDWMTALVEASLVVPDHRDGQKRFRFLETTHAYAAQRLDASGERERIAERHAAFVAGYAERYRAQVAVTAGDRWIDEQLCEAENIRVAVAWAFAHPERAAFAARLCVALVFYWSRRFFDIPAAVVLLERALEQAGARADADPQLVADLAHGLGQLLSLTGHGARVGPLATRALELYRTTGDDAGAARALSLIGHGLMNVAPHDLDAAERVFQEARELARRANEQRVLGLAGRGLGRIATQREEYERAEQILAATVDVYRRLDDTVGTALVLGALAYCAHARDDHAVAVRRAREAHEILRETHADYETGWNLMNVASFEASVGEMAEARRSALRAIEVLSRGHHQSFAYNCFETLSYVALAEGAAARATSLFAFANRGRFDEPPTAPERRSFRAHLDELRRAMGAQFDEAWHEGAAWTIEHALAVEAAGTTT